MKLQLKINLLYTQFQISNDNQFTLNYYLQIINYLQHIYSTIIIQINYKSYFYLHSNYLHTILNQFIYTPYLIKSILLQAGKEEERIIKTKNNQKTYEETQLVRLTHSNYKKKENDIYNLLNATKNLKSIANCFFTKPINFKLILTSVDHVNPARLLAKAQYDTLTRATTLAKYLRHASRLFYARLHEQHRLSRVKPHPRHEQQRQRCLEAGHLQHHRIVNHRRSLKHLLSL